MNETIRCFFAIPLPQELKDKIDLYISELKKIYPQVKWIKAGSLHITLKFLGNIDPGLVEEVSITAMDMPLIMNPFHIKIKGTGVFPNRHKPRIIWLGIQSIPHQPLYNLQESLETNLELLGFEKEKRRFNPHLTIGRVKMPTDFEQLWQYIDTSTFSSAEFEANEFLLMRSFLKPTGAEYRIIQKYPLRLS